MPLPSPRKGEEKQDFISRCMGDEEARKTYPDGQQRSAVCYKQWEDKHGKENASVAEIVSRWTGVSSRSRAMRGGIDGLLACHARLSQVTAKTARYRFRNVNGGGAEIYIRGPIGQDFFGDGISGASFTRELKALGNVKTIDVYIDSPGGSVTDGQVIYNQLVMHDAKVNCIVDGFAASAASFVAMAGDHISMGEGCYMMIHEAEGVAGGRAKDLRKMADLLDSVTQTIAQTYVARTGVPKQTVLDWMEEETWFTGQEAMDNRFVDELIPCKMPAKAVAYSAAFANMPAAATARASRKQQAKNFLERSRAAQNRGERDAR